jgi:hypothetical protein
MRDRSVILTLPPAPKRRDDPVSATLRMAGHARPGTFSPVTAYGSAGDDLGMGRDILGFSPKISASALISQLIMAFERERVTVISRLARAQGNEIAWEFRDG